MKTQDDLRFDARSVLVTPSSRQLAWQRTEFYAFVHFSVNTFTNREWGDGTEPPSCFAPARLDTDQWARCIRDAGMGGAILTCKHHDGFCLFDSAYTDFKSTNTPAGRDFVREFLDAARSAGLRAGLYFSLIDWRHPDYPHFGDPHHPMRDNPACQNEGRNFQRYLDYMHAQVRELCANYGKLDLLWFDFSYDQLRGEAWRGTELMEMVRSLQPEVVVNNRLEASGEGFGSLAACAPTPYHGDFITPEQIVPPAGLRDAAGDPLVWESCVTMNNHWGYCATDRFYKPASMLIRTLVECVSKGGNLLLNVGPDAQGRFPRQSQEILVTVYSSSGRSLPEAMALCRYFSWEARKDRRISAS